MANSKISSETGREHAWHPRHPDSSTGVFVCHLENTGGSMYNGLRFEYCPYCGQELDSVRLGSVEKRLTLAANRKTRMISEL